jgi:type I restriction enzyme S subunit
VTTLSASLQQRHAACSGDVAWQEVKVKYLATRIGSGKTPRGGNEVYVPSGVLFIRSMNVYDDGLRLDDVVYIDDATDREMSQTRVLPADVLLNITGASIGRTCIVPADLPPANVNQHVCIIRLHQRADPAFVSYVFKSSLVKDQIRALENGSSREGLNFEQVGNLTIQLPGSLAHQRAIAAFLDRKTAEIDSVIARKERLIALLQEERQALISRAVTRGLDAGAAMKDSGFPWLGEMPSHWTLSQPKHLATKIVDGVHSTPDYVLEGVPFVTVKNLTAGMGISFDDVKYISPADHVEFSKRANPEVGDILITKDGTLGTVRIITDGRPFSIFVSVALIKPRHEVIVSRFFAYALESQTTLQQFQARQLGSALKHIHLVELKNVFVLRPPIPEQHAICEYLDRVTARIERLVAKNTEQITKLREYRQALISVAVTGKLALPQEVSS